MSMTLVIVNNLVKVMRLTFNRLHPLSEADSFYNVSQVEETKFG